MRSITTLRCSVRVDDIGADGARAIGRFSSRMTRVGHLHLAKQAAGVVMVIDIVVSILLTLVLHTLWQDTPSIVGPLTVGLNFTLGLSVCFHEIFDSVSGRIARSALDEAASARHARLDEHVGDVLNANAFITPPKTSPYRAATELPANA